MVIADLLSSSIGSRIAKPAERPMVVPLTLLSLRTLDEQTPWTILALTKVMAGVWFDCISSHTSFP